MTTNKTAIKNLYQIRMKIAHNKMTKKTEINLK